MGRLPRVIIGAPPSYRESLRLRRYLADKEGIAENLESWAVLASAEGRHADAVRLHAAAEAYRRVIGAPTRPEDIVKHTEQLTAARQVLGAAAYDEAWSARCSPLNRPWNRYNSGLLAISHADLRNGRAVRC